MIVLHCCQETVFMYGQHIQQSLDLPGTAANPARGQPNRTKNMNASRPSEHPPQTIFLLLSPFARENLVSGNRFRPFRPASDSSFCHTQDWIWCLHTGSSPSIHTVHQHGLMYCLFHFCVCVCVFSSHLFWTSGLLDVPAGVTQEEGPTGFLIHLPSAVHAFIFHARRIQPFLSLVDREVEFCALRPTLMHTKNLYENGPNPFFFSGPKT